MQVILLFYVAITVPLNFAFDIEKVPLTAEWWVELFVDLYFIVDIMLNFSTSDSICGFPASSMSRNMYEPGR